MNPAPAAASNNAQPANLTFERVTKFYGPVIGVNEVSATVGPGITGLIGANGAGKSTLIKLASGQLRPSLGSVTIGGRTAGTIAAQRQLGYCPDINHFYEEMTGREFVLAMARLYGWPRRETSERSEYVLSRVGMTALAERRLAGCSHGMRQRIKLAQALVNDPPLLLLDEPLNGVDPGGRRDINELLVRLAEAGTSILVSSHILADVEQLADTILMISRGRVTASGTLAEVRAQLADYPLSVFVGTPQPRALAAQLVVWSEVRAVEPREDGLVVHTTQPERFFAGFNRLAATAGVEVQRLEILDEGAEAVFGYMERGTA